MKKFVIAGLVFAIATTLGLYNIGHFPKMVGDEGIYVAQAWWMTHFGQMGPYTYWYDHFPLGWVQIGLWQQIVGPNSFLGSSVLSARVLMGIILGGSTTALYLLTHRLTKSIPSSIVASMLFITSALTLTFGRMVLLDNLAVFWFLLALNIILANPHKLRNLIFSAIALAIAILSKESLLFFLPPYLVLTYYLNKDNDHKKYALLTNFTTIFFLLSLFPILAILKGELLPHPNQVSFLGTILFQASRGSGISFWQQGSHFSQILQVWLSIDPIIIFLGSLATLATPLLPLPAIQKFISIFTVFFIFFLIRGGQIYDFYIIPILPLLAANLALLINYYATLSKTKIYTFIFFGSLLIYFIINSLYPLTTEATHTQLQATAYLKQLPNDSLIISNNYSYLDLILHNRANIHWYSKIESDPPITKSYLSSTAQKYILADETITREASNGEIPFIQTQLLNSTKITQFGRELGPGEAKTIKPYSSEYLILYEKKEESQENEQIVALTKVDQDLLTLLKSHPPYGVLILSNNFNNTTDLQNLITSLKKDLAPTTKIIISQDDTDINTIPWLSSPKREFYKSAGEANLATNKKTQALKKLGFTAAIITSSTDSDKFLSPILSAAKSELIPIIRFDGNIPTTDSIVSTINKAENATLLDAKYKGKLLEIITAEEFKTQTKP